MNINRTFIVTIVVTFIVALFIGYGIRGDKKEEKFTVKQLLNKIGQEVELIEKENQDLKEKIKSSEGSDKAIKEISQEKQNIQEQLQKAQENNQKLESEIIEIKAKLSQTEERLKAAEELTASSDTLKIRLAELEKENQNLKLILKKIDSITKGQESELPQQPHEEPVKGDENKEE